MDCGRLTSDEERLACYDAVHAARLGGEPTQPARPDPAQSSPAADSRAGPADVAAAEAGFGFPQPATRSELEELRSPVVKVGVNAATKRYIFHLENGQVWEQAEGRNFVVPDEPLVAVISPGLWSSFRLSFEGRKQWVKVRRIK